MAKYYKIDDCDIGEDTIVRDYVTSTAARSATAAGSRLMSKYRGASR